MPQVIPVVASWATTVAVSTWVNIAFIAGSPAYGAGRQMEFSGDNVGRIGVEIGEKLQ